jgi:hypothetical protein
LSGSNGELSIIEIGIPGDLREIGLILLRIDPDEIGDPIGVIGCGSRNPFDNEYGCDESRSVIRDRIGI